MDVPDRVGRAFRDHASFEQVDERTFESVATAFEGRVSVAPADDGHIEYAVQIRVPMLDAVVDGDVAPVVEDGWYETFALRVEDIGGVTRVDRDLEPTVYRDGDEAVVEVTLVDIDERRGVDDAGAVIDYVEGTYVQGIIPGYDYTDPATGLIDHARETAGDGGR